MKIGNWEFNFGRKPAPAQPSRGRAMVVSSDGNILSVTDPYEAGSNHTSGNSEIHTLVNRLSLLNMDHRSRLELNHIVRAFIPDVQTALIGRRAIEGELTIHSDDEGLQTELREFARTIKVGYIEGAGCPVGLNLYLDCLADSVDEYGLAVGEKMFNGRQLERLVTPDMRTFSIDKDYSTGRVRLVQDQNGKLVPIESGTVHTMTFKHSNSSYWPPALIWGAEYASEAVLRLIISLNTIWLKAGDPPMLYSIEYDADAKIQTETVQRPDGQLVQVDVNLRHLAKAIQDVKAARRRGIMAEIIMSVGGGTIKAEPVFGNPTTAGLVKEAEPHYRILSGQIAQLAEVPSWLFASGSNKSEGIGSNRSNQEASIAFAGAERRRPKIEPVAKDILNTFLLTQRAQRSLNNFRFEWTAPSIINEKLIEETRAQRATADSTFVRTSYEAFNPEGIAEDGKGPLNEEQREYLKRNGFLIDDDE